MTSIFISSLNCSSCGEANSFEVILVCQYNQHFRNLYLLGIIIDVDFWKGGKLLW